LELKRRGKEIFYHRDKKECDFIIREDGVIQEAFQVCYSLADVETKKREIDGLIEAMKIYNLKTGTILVYDDLEQDLNIDDRIIRIISVWKWLII
jgi:predicted AAA+ superfamily ATPase